MVMYLLVAPDLCINCLLCQVWDSVRRL